MATSIFPGKYVQRYEALFDLAEETENFGEKSLIIMDEYVYDNMLSEIKEHVIVKIKALFEKFLGECTDNEIKRLAEVGRGVDFIVGIGGGKTLDTAKAVAYKLKKPVVIVPTIASTDAPCSALSVIYKEDGSFDRYLVLPSNPDLVLVDTKIIVQSPSRFLVSGMGDALATWFEAESAMIKNAPNMTGDVGTMTAYSLAKLCYETLMNYGKEALVAAKRQAVTPALEKVIEANTLLSGLGFESGGLASCHAIHNGLTALEKTHKFWHGEKVSIGVLTSLFLNNKDRKTLEEVYSFCETVGLPTTLKEIGLKKVKDEDLYLVAKLSAKEGETIYNEPVEITLWKIVDAIKAADQYGRERKGKK